MTRLAPIIACVLAIVAGGCMSRANERLTLGSRIVLDGFRTTDESAADAGPLDAGAGAPLGVGVRSWAPIAVDVPIGGVGHRPTWRSPMYVLDVTPRQRGEYPTAESSLDSIGDRLDYQIAEGIRGNAWTIPELLLIVPRAILHGPMELAVSPVEPYARRWWREPGIEPDAPVGTVRPEGAGAITPEMRTNVRSGGGV